MFAQNSRHPVSSAHWHGGFVDNDQRGAHIARNINRSLAHILQISLAVHARWRSHCNESKFCASQRFGIACSEAQTARINIALHQLGQARLENWQLPAVQVGNAFRVNINAANIIAEVGEAGACDQSHISTPDDGNIFHLGLIEIICAMIPQQKFDDSKPIMALARAGH